MDKNQVKLKIDDLIKRCNILENGDIYTAPDDYYKWIRIKVCAKIAHTNYKLNIAFNYLVITIAVISLLTSILSLLNTLGIAGVTKNDFWVYVFVLFIAALSIIIIFAIDKFTNKKNMKNRENLFLLKELLDYYTDK